MALRIWLPLNGSLENKGISDITVTNNGATVDNNGKIGKCYKHLNCSITNLQNMQIYPMTIAFWMKSSDTSTQWQKIVMFDNTDLTQIHGIYIADSARIKYEYNPSLNIHNALPGEWHHYTFVIDNKQSYGYYDGVLSATSSEAITLDTLRRIRIGEGANIYLNDVRIYDHCLSPLEVKEISQGLILHYKLNDNIQILDNCYSYPTFNTSSGYGGWSHWGRSGHAGSQGQNTDKTYIYNKENTYSHWVSNGETATGEYLVYQSPAFDGGYRSLQAIIKEENGSPINEDICFPAWNARNGGAIAYQWTSITSLGNGFYLCKCEGISQDGSNDLVGIYVKPGYKIYISEAYLENNKQLCSEILYPRNYIIDSSGYGNDGVVEGNITISKDSARYNYSSYFNGSTNVNLQSIYDNTVRNKQLTVACWIKYTQNPTQDNYIYRGLVEIYIRTAYNSNPYPLFITWNHATDDSTNSNTWYAGYNTIINTWFHVCYVFDAGIWKLYINGQHVNTSDRTSTGTYIYGNKWNDFGTNFIGMLNDFRIYATALSAEDILDLYHTSAQVDNLGGIHGFEFEEKQGNMLAVSPLAGSLTWDSENNYYVITSQPSTSNWGIGPSVGVTPKKIIPWGYSYRLSYEVYSPTAATWYVDYNNNTVDVTLSGNDNDTGRIATGVAVPANQWTLITLGCSNTNSTKNPDHLPLYDYSSGLGPVMTNISSPITWYMRNPQWYLVDTDESTNFQIYENGIFKTNFLKEDNLNDFASFRNNEKATWGVNIIEK